MNDIRQKFWTEVYLAYLNDPHYTHSDIITMVDEALRAFDARFPPNIGDLHQKACEGLSRENP